MEQEHSGATCKSLQLASKAPINVSDKVRKYRLLQTAVNQGHIRTIDSLLDDGVQVNGYPICRQLCSPLHLSISSGNLEIIDRLLNKGASVNVKYSGDTPLTFAAKLLKFEIVDLLLLSNGLENCANDDKLTHFHIACMRNQPSIAQKMLLSKRDVNETVVSSFHFWPGFTALHFAVQFQCMGTLKFLLNIGADMTIRDAQKFTPLQLAYILGHEEMVDVILSSHGGIVCNPLDYKRPSHFEIACARNHTKLVEYFIELGADPRAATRGDSSISGTILGMAIEHGCLDVAKILLQYNTLETFQGTKDLNFFKVAYCTGNIKILDSLIKESKLDQRVRKFKPNFFELFNDCDGRLIHEWFSTNPGELNCPITLTGCTALHVAIEWRNKKVSEFLVNRGADYTIQNVQGKSSLHLAFEYNMNDLVNLMLNNGKPFFENLVDEDGLSHFHIACASNNAKAVQSFLKLGVSVNSFVNFNSTFWPGYTPLHFTAEFNCEKVAHILLKHGANYSATNASNLSAFDIAFMKANSLFPFTNYYGQSLSNTDALDCMKLILRFHSKRKDERFNDRGVSLLHLACMKFDSCSYPLDEEGVSHHKEISYFTPLKELIKLLKSHSGEVNKAIHKMNSNWDGFTPLHFAVKNHDSTEHAMLLIENGADVLAQDANGDTPLHWSLWSGVFPGTSSASQDPRFLQLNHIGTRGFSFFHIACIERNLKMMKYFLEHGVDPNCPSLNNGLGYDDKAPLHLVIERLSYFCSSTGQSNPNAVDAIKLLLKYGANPNVRDFQKNTPLHLMCKCRKHSEIIDILVSHGADLDTRNAQLGTPLASFFDELFKLSWHGPLSDFIGHIASFLDNGANFYSGSRENKTPFSAVHVLVTRGPNLAEDIPDVVKMIDLLGKYAIKLENIGIRMSERDREFFVFLLNKFSDRLSLRANIYNQMCVNELELLKKTQTDANASICDLLFSQPTKLAVRSHNETLQNIVNSDDFCRKYPIYGPLVKSRLKQGQVRWRWMNESVESLKTLFGITLPRICSDIILQYLSIEDLRNIVASQKSRR